ncbi:hypothetical protein G6F32_015360 [Rhizopus arrhizus]|nr:hypothetical protein G6F32_015360 [Rhizopus arrhizus]
MTGPGRVNPEVRVDMDFSVTEEARELYNGRAGCDQQQPAGPAGRTGHRAGADRKQQERDPQLRAGPHPAAHPPAGRPHQTRLGGGAGGQRAARRCQRQGCAAAAVGRRTDPGRSAGQAGGRFQRRAWRHRVGDERPVRA